MVIRPIKQPSHSLDQVRVWRPHFRLFPVIWYVAQHTCFFDEALPKPLPVTCHHYTRLWSNDRVAFAVRDILRDDRFHIPNILWSVWRSRLFWDAIHLSWLAYILSEICHIVTFIKISSLVAVYVVLVVAYIKDMGCQLSQITDISSGLPLPDRGLISRYTPS